MSRPWRRAAEDVRPYHAPRHVRAHGRARRPRRAVYAKAPAGTPRTRGRPRQARPSRVAQVGAALTFPSGRPRQARPSRVAHGRARRPRRAVYAKTPTGTPRTRGRPRTSAPTRKKASVYSVTGRRPFCVFCGKKKEGGRDGARPSRGKTKRPPEGGGL